MGEVQSSKSKSDLARGRMMRAREAAADWTMDFRLITRGGGVVLALVAVGLAGWFLPWLLRLGLVALVAYGLSRLHPPEPPEALVLPFAWACWAWLAVAWIWPGLLSAVVVPALLSVIAVGLVQWHAWRQVRPETSGAETAPAPDPPPPPPPPLTPDELLDQVLSEAGHAGISFGDLEVAMSGRMSRSTLAGRLRAGRGMQIGRGRWRAPIARPEAPQ